LNRSVQPFFMHRRCNWLKKRVPKKHTIFEDFLKEIAAIKIEGLQILTKK